MYTDIGLRLATAESVPNSGQGGIGADSLALGLDLSSVTSALRNYNDVGAGHRLQMALNVTTGFECDTFNSRMEFQLISLPIAATSLTAGIALAKTLAVTSLAGDTITVASHGLPLGTPIFLTDIVTSTGIQPSVIYYVIPVTANTFKVALNLFDAIAGTEIDILTGNGTATVNFIPTVHASTGSLPMFDDSDPTYAGPLGIGERLVVPLRPLASMSPKQSLPAGQALTQPLGAAGVAAATGTGVIAATAQRFFYLHYVPSAAILAGAVTVDLVVDAGEGLTMPASGFQVTG